MKALNVIGYCLLWSTALSAASAQSTQASGGVPPRRPVPAGTLSSPGLSSFRSSITPASQASGLAVVANPEEAAKGQDTNSGNSSQFDFGSVNALDTPLVKHTFTLRNTSSKPLTLERLQPSCHCTSALIVGSTVKGNIAGDSQGKLPTLAPGAQATIQVTVDLSELAPGQLTKSVLVFVQGNTFPAATLTFTGQLLPLVTFSPAVLDFGQTTSEQAKSLPLTVSLDPRLVASGTLPSLVSSNPALQISDTAPATVSQGKAVSPGTSPQPPPSEVVSQMMTRTYSITLAKGAPLGPLSGSLAFAPLNPVAAEATLNALDEKQTTAAQAFSLASALVVGQVTGDASAAPGTLTFGQVRLGQESARQVVLTGTRSTALQNMKVASASPFLSVRVMKAGSGTGITGENTLSQVLEVRISSQAPPGILQSQVKVVLSNGQRLLIPVTAYVSATAGL